MGRTIGIILALLIAAAAARSCENQPEATTQARSEPAGQAPAPLTPPPASESEEPIPVTSDPASYSLLRARTLPSGNLEVLTRRDGKSGTSYSRREIDCAAGTFRYVGEGDTREQAEEDGPNPGDMGPLMEPSISSETAIYVCAREGRPRPPVL